MNKNSRAYSEIGPSPSSSASENLSPPIKRRHTDQTDRQTTLSCNFDKYCVLREHSYHKILESDLTTDTAITTADMTTTNPTTTADTVTISSSQNLKEEYENFGKICEMSGDKEINLTKTDCEIIRLFGQYLIDRNLYKTKNMLVLETGLNIENNIITKFRALIMSGYWDAAKHYLNELRQFLPKDKLEENIQKMKFILMEQKYLELLENNKANEAVEVLRNDLIPLNCNKDRVKKLPLFLINTDKENLYHLSKWYGKGEKTCLKVLNELQQYIPASIMLPSNRLINLIDQAAKSQIDKCLYHNLNYNNHKMQNENDNIIENISLLKDHACTLKNFQIDLTRILLERSETEFTCCQISIDGLKMATGTKNKCLILWKYNLDTEDFQVDSMHDMKIIITKIDWNPSSNSLLIAGKTDRGTYEVRIWEFDNRKFKDNLYIEFCSTDNIIICKFNKDGTKFATATHDGYLFVYHLSGYVVRRFKFDNVTNLSFCLDNKYVLISESLSNKIKQINLKSNTKIVQINNYISETCQIINFVINSTDTLALINVNNYDYCLHLWDLKTNKIIQKFRHSNDNDTKNNNYLQSTSSSASSSASASSASSASSSSNMSEQLTMLSCFGGINENYILSVTNYWKKLFIFHINKTEPIYVHNLDPNENISCISWNLKFSIFITCTDQNIKAWKTQFITE